MSAIFDQQDLLPLLECPSLVVDKNKHQESLRAWRESSEGGLHSRIVSEVVNTPGVTPYSMLTCCSCDDHFLLLREKDYYNLLVLLSKLHYCMTKSSMISH